MVFFSVILPYFNSEKTIFNCVESVLKQSFKNFELIIVDDGSSDNSSNFIQHLIKIDNRIVFVKQTNKGVSSARNRAIDLAKGKFLAFIDSDDCYHKDFLHFSYESLKSLEYDLLICNVNKIVNGKFVLKLDLKNSNFETPFRSKPFLNQFLDYKYDYSNWNKIYSNEIVKMHNIKFNNKLHLFEDLLFNLEYIYFSERIKIANEAFYYYTNNVDGLCNQMDKNKLHQKKILFESINSKFDNANFLINKLTSAILSEYLTMCRNESINNSLKLKFERDLIQNEFFFKGFKTIFSLKRILFNLRLFGLVLFLSKSKNLLKKKN